MRAIFISWGASGGVLILLAIVLGLRATGRVDGILIDERGRYSLAHFQACLWTIVVLSLISGVFFGRLVHGVASPLQFTIPPEVLGLIGISLGSAVTATAVKRTKDLTRTSQVAASGGSSDPPVLAQIFLLEEGAFANKAVDIGKFQNFVFTIVLVVAYIALAVHAVMVAGTANAMKALPGFAGTFLTLLAISHGAYVAGKLPSPSGTPTGLNLDQRNQAPGTYEVKKRGG